MKSSGTIFRPLGRVAVSAMVIAQITGAALAQPLSRPVSGDSYRQDYSALAEHNIFLKDRVRQPAPATRGAGENRIRPSAQQSLVVTGIVCDDQQQYILVENVFSGSVQRLLEGDRVAGGIVIDIAIDRVMYAPDGQGDGSISVRSGANLTGAFVESVAAERRRWATRGVSVDSSTLPSFGE